MFHFIHQNSFYNIVKTIAFAGFLFIVNSNLYANEYKESIKKSTLLIATNNEDVVKGLAKSTYNVTPYKVIDYLPDEIPDNVIHYNISGNYGYATIHLMLRYKKTNITISKIHWNRPLKTASDFRAMYNHFDQLVREYLLYADDKGKLDEEKVKDARKKELVSLADNIKKTTFYASSNNSISGSNDKWDKKNGKVKNSSDSELSRIIEAAEDSNGYYIVTEKKNKNLYATGYVTGIGFVIAALIPKYQTTIYTTNSDRSLGGFRIHNPYKNSARLQKKLLKFTTKK